MKEYTEQSEELIIYPKISLKDFMETVAYMASEIMFNGGLEEDIYVAIEQDGTVLSLNCKRLETDEEVTQREQKKLVEKYDRQKLYEILKKEFE